MIGADCWEIIQDYKEQLEFADKFKEVMKEYDDNIEVYLDEGCGRELVRFADNYRLMYYCSSYVARIINGMDVYLQGDNYFIIVDKGMAGHLGNYYHIHRLYGKYIFMSKNTNSGLLERYKCILRYTYGDMRYIPGL